MRGIRTFGGWKVSRISKFLGKTKLHLTIWQRVSLITIMLAMALCGGMVGSAYTYYHLTGTLPNTYQSSQSISLPDIKSKVTEREVMDFVRADTTNLNKYDIGFNCVEYAFLQARNAQWKSLPAVVTLLDFEGGESHLILAFPTTDAGVVFIDPKLSLEIHPRVGMELGGYKVTEISFMKIVWIPIEEVTK